MKRVVNINVLPGEPLDGRGKVCIHLFVQDPTGSFIEPHALHPVYKDGELVKQQVEARPTRGRLACDNKRNVAPVTKNGITTVTLRSDDPRGVSCPKCKASQDYKRLMDLINT